VLAGGPFSSRHQKTFCFSLCSKKGNNMSAESPSRYMVLADLHFGMVSSSVNDPEVVSGLSNYLAEKNNWQAIIFSGDLLDLNLTTFSISIEGKRRDGLKSLGFRQFIENIYQPSSPRFKVKKWIYIPGNHDYKIWDILSTGVVCEDVLADGKPMGTVPTPLTEYTWPAGEAFISGVFPPDIRKSVTVIYPDYVIEYSPGKTIVVTHGHYLDRYQTIFNCMSRLKGSPLELRSAIREIFIKTAQYQTVANAVSFTIKTRKLFDLFRKLFDLLFGHDSIDKIMLKVMPNDLWEIFKVLVKSPLRDKPIDVNQLRTIEHYLKYYRGYSPIPDYFVFGHTHCQGESMTERIPTDERLIKNKNIRVFNAGSFYPKGDKKATFIEIMLTKGQEPDIRLKYIDAYGTVH